MNLAYLREEIAARATGTGATPQECERWAAELAKAIAVLRVAHSDAGAALRQLSREVSP